MEKTGLTERMGLTATLIVTSKEFTVTNWVKAGVDFKGVINYAPITQDIVNNGVVLVYVKAGSEYFALPVTVYPADFYSTTFSVSHYLGGLTIYVADSDLLTLKPDPLKFKVVIMTASNARMAGTVVNLNNYEDVKNYFSVIEVK